MVKLMHAGLWRIGGALLAGALLAIPAAAQEKAAANNVAPPKAAVAAPAGKNDLSPKSVTLITGFALTTIPSEITTPDGKVLKIDKSDPSKLVVPFEDAKHVIKVAYMSAKAQNCDMSSEQSDNYNFMISQERAKKKWTEEQMLFINRLHLFTVMWLTGNVKITENDGKQEAKVSSGMEAAPPKKVCTPEDKANLRKEIEAFWNGPTKTQ
jgi:hypothetical protein